MRHVLSIIQWIALLIAGGALAYLLFVLGHTELVSHGRVLLVACVAGGGALAGGLAHWVAMATKGEAGAHSTRHRRRGAR